MKIANNQPIQNCHSEWITLKKPKHETTHSCWMSKWNIKSFTSPLTLSWTFEVKIMFLVNFKVSSFPNHLSSVFQCFVPPCTLFSQEGLSAFCVRQHWLRPLSQIRSGTWSCERQNCRAKSILVNTSSASGGGGTSHRSPQIWFVWHSSQSRLLHTLGLGNCWLNSSI